MGTERVDREGVAEAETLIRHHVRRTPVIEVAAQDFGLAGEALRLKLEQLQHTGSFKVRGAFTNLLTHNVPPAGVVAASGGNHGAAVAYAAMRCGVDAKVFVPTVASPAKVSQIRGYGADLVIAGERYADALAASEDYRARSGAMAVHAYDQVGTLCGQGTVGLELEGQAPDLDTLLVAVGGGGLIGGIAAWYGRTIRLVGVEPVTAPTLTRALEAGRPVDAEAGGIAADSLAPRQVGRLMFPIAQEFVDDMALVEDQAIAETQAQLWRTLRMVAEPGGAAALAALISGAYRPSSGERVGVLICGANTTAVDFGRA